MLCVMSWQARVLGLLSRRVARPRLARQRDPMVARTDFLRSVRLFLPDPPGAVHLPDRVGATPAQPAPAPRVMPSAAAPLGGIPALWARPAGGGGAGLVLFVHGGAMVMGSPRTHRGLALRLAGPVGCDALLPHYRLAPEHPFPAAFDDVCAAYLDLLARGHRPGRIVLAGDSGGGALALALLAAIGRHGWPAPAGAVVFSPLTDMSFSGASVAQNAARDLLLPAERCDEVAQMYLQGADPRDPRASPLWADWAVPPPPVFLAVAETEILRDDTLRMAARLRAAGGEAVVCRRGIPPAPPLPHVWPFLAPWLPEGRETLAEAQAFIRARLRARRQADS